MKKMVLFFVSILMTAFLIDDIDASAYREVYADYRDAHVTLNVKKYTISGFSGPAKKLITTRSVSFKISARPGYKLSAKSHVGINGKRRTFKGTDCSKKHYTTGSIRFRGTLGRNGAFRLVYFVRKDGSAASRRVSKKLRLTLDRIPNPHGRTEGRIVEVR